ncbi:MAG: hypothetical protein JWO14_2840 [Solirubrobacterales bacterium]|nr:hypothetical protein [Solirubrobacterales bacterium]
MDARPPDDYFLGLVVLDTNDQIQDGQQRLATTLLFASSIFSEIEDAKASGPHDSQIANDAMAAVVPALRQNPSVPLRISPQDQEVLLNRAGIRGDSLESSKRLVAARSRLSSHLKADLQSRPSPDARLARLKQWGTFLRQEAYVVVLRVRARDAHNIFETLNTRGVRLSNGDLVKSHLISRATDTGLAILKWNEVIGALKDSSGRYEDDLESFLLHYFGSRYGRTTKAEFFTDYRTAIANTDALAALEELIENAKLYRGLADPGDSSALWDQIGPGTQQAIELLNGLGLKQLRYLLLAVMRDLAGKKPTKSGRNRQRSAVLKITAWSMRGLVDDRTGGGDAERAYIRGALGIQSRTITTVPQLKSHFVDTEMLTLSDAQFLARFQRFPFDRPTSHKRARAVLYALEYQKIANKSGLKPRDTLTVEHVLPRSPAEGQWTAFTAEDLPSYTYMLGNLILVDGPSGANDDLANREWAMKKQRIRSFGQQTPLTTEALKRKSWTKAIIERRTSELARLAVKGWSA